MPESIKLMLTQSINTLRWYYTVKDFKNVAFVTSSGYSAELLAPRSTTDVSKLPDTAITALLCPKELNDLTREELTDPDGEYAFPETITIDPSTGQPIG
jgi:hypothetical protein